jgi:hypothetical protein
MSTRYNDGSHYENHQRATELQDYPAHAHRVGEEHGKQEHLTPHELSRLERERAGAGPQEPEKPTTGHGMTAFGHAEIAELAHTIWESKGRPEGSAEEDWHQAVEELRSRNLGL